MENRYAEQLIAVITQLKRQQELSINELNGHLGVIARQLEKIDAYLVEEDEWPHTKGDS